MAQSYQLVMESGPTPGKIFDLAGAEAYIGRDISNDIVINDAEISRKHVHITQQGGSYVLEDLGSTNGTIINGQRITGQYVLQGGDTLMLGANVVLTFSAAGFDPDVTAIADIPDLPQVPIPEPVVAESQPTPTMADFDEYADPEPTPMTPPPAPVPAYAAPAGTGTEEYAAFDEEEPEPAAAAGGGNRNRFILAGCGCVVILGCIVVAGGAWYIDANNLWCDILPFLGGC